MTNYELFDDNRLNKPEAKVPKKRKEKHKKKYPHPFTVKSEKITIQFICIYIISSFYISFNRLSCQLWDLGEWVLEIHSAWLSLCAKFIQTAAGSWPWSHCPWSNCWEKPAKTSPEKLIEKIPQWLWHNDHNTLFCILKKTQIKSRIGRLEVQGHL